MNLPNDKEPSLEQRVTDLEQLCGDILKNEEALIKLSQRHRFNLQQIIGAVNGLTLDMGDVRERFDGIEQAIERYGKRFDRIERILDGHDKHLDRIEHAQSEIKETQREHGQLLRAILDRLPQGE
jgi:DNA repair ATPase RecN